MSDNIMKRVVYTLRVDIYVVGALVSQSMPIKIFFTVMAGISLFLSIYFTLAA